MKEEWCVSKLIWEFISPRIAFHFKLKTSLSSVHRFSQWFWYEEQEGVLRSYMALSNNYRQLKTESKFAGNFLFLKGHITRVIIRACRCTGIWQWTMNREIFPKIWIIFEQCPTFVFLPRVVGRTETKAPPGTRRVYSVRCTGNIKMCIDRPNRSRVTPCTAGNTPIRRDHGWQQQMVLSQSFNNKWVLVQLNLGLPLKKILTENNCFFF